MLYLLYFYFCDLPVSVGLHFYLPPPFEFVFHPCHYEFLFFRPLNAILTAKKKKKTKQIEVPPLIFSYERIYIILTDFMDISFFFINSTISICFLFVALPHWLHPFLSHFMRFAFFLFEQSGNASGNIWKGLQLKDDMTRAPYPRRDSHW